jgi:acid phosphatase
MYLNCRFVIHCVSNMLIKPLFMMFLGGFMATAAAQNYQANITAASNWLASTSNPRVTLTDGAVVDGANSARINPYFANLGVIGWTKDPNHYTNVKNYMEWYWANVSWPRNFTVSGCTVNPASGALYGAINDFDVAGNGAETPVPDPDAQGNHHPDSTDSYAGTFLSLAYAYYQTGDANAQAYIRSITIGPNGDRLDYVGEVVIATKQTNNLTCARPDFNIEYLMDNAEAYRGLRDLQTLYTALGATAKASFYQAHADQMLNAIQTTLWNASNSDYFSYTTVTGASGTVNWNAWYPDAVSQVFPIALGIIQPTDTRAINLWNTFQSHWQNQWTSLSTGDSYPWVIVGYAAALMGDTADANTFITNLQNTYVNNNFVGNASHFWSTNEAGWFIRLNAQMLGSGGGGPMTHVTISTPTDGATVTAPVTVQASATSTNGVSGWHIYDENNNIVFSAGAVSSINASLSLASGAHRLTVRAWDNISGFGDQTINITVSPVQPPPPTVPSSNHVYIVVLENHSYSSVIGSSSMPFLNNNANTYSLATNYYADTHPSIGNYFEMTIGQIITNDDSYTATVTADNIVRHLIAAGKSWKEYSESIPSVGYTGGDSTSAGGPYTEHHNPLSYLSDVRGTSQANNLVPFTQLQTDINAGTLPNFGLIVPNNNDNAHDGTLSAADTWLQNNIFATLLNSAPFQAGGDGLLFVLFDESDIGDTVNGGGHVAAVLIGPKVKNGYQSTTLYQHQSLLRTVNEALGLANFGDAVNAPNMAEFFK